MQNKITNNNCKIQVRFSDVDTLGHVNNAHYLTYFETARMHFFNENVGTKWDWIEKGIILRKNEVEYILPVFLTDNVEIEVLPESIGNTSFTLSYVLKVGNVVKCKGVSVLVCYDFKNHQKNEVYHEIKRIFELFSAQN